MGVAAWAELFHIAEDQADWIVGVDIVGRSGSTLPCRKFWAASTTAKRAGADSTSTFPGF
jgi:hypothetical protein